MPDNLTERLKHRVVELERAITRNAEDTGRMVVAHAQAVKDAEARAKKLVEALQEARPVVFNAIDLTDQSAKHGTRRRILGVVDAALEEGADHD